jgi:hypothetical protein
MFICPKCGKTVNISRVYCDCHTFLSEAKVCFSEASPDVKKCNIETANVNCNDCPEDCTWCASFGSPHTNEYGFGGENCGYRKEQTRCFCCQAQIKIGKEIFTLDMNEILTSMTAEKLNMLAELIKSRIERLVIARINQKRPLAV